MSLLSLLIPLVLIVPSVRTITPWADEDKRAEHVMITPYMTQDSLNAPTIIVCPGGSYHWLDVKGEGIEVCEWLSDHGVNAVLLQYRTAGLGSFIWHYRYIVRGNRHPDMICDIQRTIRYLRENAQAMGINPGRLGVLGFSAGGHLALSSACFSKTDYTDLAAGPSKVSLRPDFVGAIYPVVTLMGEYAHARSRKGLLGEWGKMSNKKRKAMSIERNIPENCPPVFLVNCKDDPVVDWHNSVILDNALTEACVSHVYYQYETGKHGFGVSNVYGSQESREWRNEFIKWLNELQ